MIRRHAWLSIAAILGVACFGWLVAPHDPYRTNLDEPSSFGRTLLLGADTLGRDVLSRVLHGGPLTVASSGAAALLALACGGILGGLAAVGPRWSRVTADLFIQALLALPVLVIALVVVTGLGTNLTSTAVAAGIAQAGVSAQLWRGVLRSVLLESFIEGAQASGAGRWRILGAHVVPNALPLVLAYGCALFASSVLLTSGLSFLGVAGEPASPDWGNMLAEGRRAIRYAPWILLAPAIALIAVTSAIGAAARLIEARHHG